MIGHNIIDIDNKYIDIAQNLTAQWAIMWDMVNFPEPEEKQANFTSNKKKHIICLHNSCLFQMGLFMYTKVPEYVWIKTTKSAERKTFWLFTEKVLKIGNIKGSNTNLKLLHLSMTRHNVFYIHVKADASSFL